MVSMTSQSPLSGFLCRDGRRSLVFGERADGSIAHISEVPSGLLCACKCPDCGTPLVARKGGQTEHHFGHHGSAFGRPCANGPETALHKFAKEVLARNLQIFLPTLDLTDGEDRWIGFEGRKFSFDSAILEKRIDGIVPDVIARKAHRDLIIEFAVNHECGPEKIAHIKELDLSAIEIDLSRLTHEAHSLGALEAAILYEAPRKWLHNPRLREGEIELEARRRKKADAFSRKVAALSRSYNTALDNLRLAKSECLALRRIQADGLGRAIGHDVPGSGCFTVPPRDWQATILADVVDIVLSGRQSPITVKGALWKLRERRWISRRFSTISEAEATALRSANPNFELPEEAIRSWAAILSRLSILVPIIGGDRWILHPMVGTEAYWARSAAQASGR